MTREKPTCCSPLYTPKVRECSIDRFTTSIEMPVAQYEVVRKAWITARSRRLLSVLVRYSPRVHSWVMLIPPALMLCLNMINPHSKTKEIQEPMRRRGKANGLECC